MNRRNGPFAILVFALMFTTIFSSLPLASGLINLDQNGAQASIVGYTDGATLGRFTQVSGGGDVNGDGYDDLVFGVPNSYEDGWWAGAAYIVFGPSTGWGKDANLSHFTTSFRGMSTGDEVGYSVSIVGDVNGDGYDDVLVSALSSLPSTAGDRVYLIFGKASGWGTKVDIATADVNITPEVGNTQTGYGVGGAGDVNGDGLADMLISAPNFVSGGTNKGKVYLVLGKRGAWNATYNLTNADGSFIGTSSMLLEGYEVKTAGDVNGDGCDEILMDGWATSGPGNNTLYLFMGKKTAWAKNVSILSASYSWGWWGLTRASGGVDINLDGYEDIVIGDVNLKNGSIYPGGANLTLGGPNAPTTWGYTKTFIGEEDNSLTGRGVALVDDATGDDYGELLIDSPLKGRTAAPTREGKLYLITGNDTTNSNPMLLVNEFEVGFGNANGEEYGYPMKGGDLDGDALEEIIVGVPNHDVFTPTTIPNCGGLYVLSLVNGTTPTSVSSVKAYGDAAYTREITLINRTETAYIELTGVDGSPTTVDRVVAKVSSNSTSPVGFTVHLKETGVNTGRYRGSINVTEFSRKDKNEIGAGPGERITIASLADPSKKAVLDVYGQPMLFPDNMTFNATEDMPFSFHFWSYNWSDLVWTMQTGADWLAFSTVTGNLTGTPNNGDVGSSWVKLRAQNKFGLFDERNMTLNVNNTQPNITTTNVLTGTEHVYYRVDYNSTDDGQGSVGWHVKTDAAWLAMDVLTGVLNGTPGDNDTGPHWVNVSVDDGNGGKAWTNFTLTIGNVNDAPVIITEDRTWALADENYAVPYDAIDADGDVLTWAFETNATSWLAMDVSHVLKGKPTGANLGSWWANVSVTDGKGGSDHHLFIINVSSTNDPPTITTTVDITKAFIGKEYSAQYNAVDPDPGDTLTWTVERDPVTAGWLTIDAATGLLHGTPGIQGYVGTHHVTVMVSDPYGGNDTRDFDLTVIANSPPEITSTPVVVATVGKPYNYNVDATDADGDVVIFSLVEAPEGMTIDATFGQITWTPKGSQVGQNTVTVKVSDDDFGVTQTFIIDVNKGGGNNRPPVIEPIGDRTVKPGEALMFRVVATDKDNDALTYSLGNAPAGMTINDTGWVLWPDTGAKGSYVITVTVSDGMATTSDSFTLVVDEGGGGGGGGGSNSVLLAGMLLVGLVVGIVLILVVVFVVVFLMMRKKGGSQALTAPPPAQLPPQYQNQQYPQPQPPPPQPPVQPQYQQPYQYPPGPQQ